MEQPGFFRRRVIEPVMQLMRIGATPHRLAWSIAIGAVIGVNPLLGSTTLVALAVAPPLRLNVIAAQLGNHLMYPVEILLFPVFLRLGITFFHTPRLPLAHGALVQAVRFHPWNTTRLLWTWEWHALVVWAVCATVAAPLLQRALRIVLERMFVRLHHEPVMEI